MRRAYSYKRFSSPKQARGDSIRRQTEFEQKVVKEMGLLLDDTIDLSDTGVSAFHGKNNKFGALAEFLRMVEAGRIPPGSVLIVENIDRLSRENVFDAYNLFARLLSAGLTIVTMDDTYSKESVQDNLAKLMVPLMYMVRAHDESKTKSYRVHKAWNSRRERAVKDGQPLTERCPAWLKVKDGKYVLREDRAETIRLIYQWTREGLGAMGVVKRLVAEKVKPFGRKDGWHLTYVRKLLGWPAVYGQMQPCLFKEGKRVKHGDPVLAYFPAVITREEFEVTRATIRMRKGKDGGPTTGEVNILAGLCWHLGDRARMSTKLMTGRRKKYTYIRSNLCDKGASARDARQFPYDVLERAVLDALRELRPEDLSDRFREQKQEIDERVDSLGGQVGRMGDVCETLQNKLLDPNGTESPDVLADNLAKAAAVRDQLRQALAEAQAACANDRSELPGPRESLVDETEAMGPGPERDKLRRKIRTRIRWLVEEVWVHIEKVNHMRSFAHVQVFLRNGAKKAFVVPSFAQPKTPVWPGRDYAEVDFRTHRLGPLPEKAQ